jgi:hypothetical protein
MMTKFSKWLLYIASYGPLYVMLAVKILINMKRKDSETFIESLSSHIQSNAAILIILTTLFLASIFWYITMFKFANNTRIKPTISGNATLETVAFIVPYLASFITIDLSPITLLVNGIVFFLLGFAFVYSDKIGMSPLFLLRGYKLYLADKQYILSRQPFDSLRLTIQDSVDGIEVREICRGTYIQMS